MLGPGLFVPGVVQLKVLNFIEVGMEVAD